MDQDYSETTPALPVPEYVPRPKPTSIPTAAWNDAPLFCLQINDQWVSHLLGVMTALDQPDTWLGTDDEIFAARQQVNEIMLALMNHCPVRFYSVYGEDVPDHIESDDGGSVELGVRFHTSVSGNVWGVKFYKDEGNTGEHHGYLYDSAFSLLGELVFVDETASGWQSGLFDVPIAIQACQTYTVSYHAPNGHYSKGATNLDDGLTVPPITFNKNSESAPGNGVYEYGDGGSYPDNTFSATNYLVDLIFEPTGADYLE